MEEDWDIVDPISSSLSSSTQQRGLELNFNRFTQQPAYEITEDDQDEDYDQQLINEGVIFSDEDSVKEPSLVLQDSNWIINDTTTTTLIDDVSDTNNELEQQRIDQLKVDYLSRLFPSSLMPSQDNSPTRESELEKTAVWKTANPGTSVPYVSDAGPSDTIDAAAPRDTTDHLDEETDAQLHSVPKVDRPTYGGNLLSSFSFHPHLQLRTSESMAQTTRNFAQLQNQLNIDMPSSQKRRIKSPRGRTSPRPNLTMENIAAFAAAPNTIPILTIDHPFPDVNIPPEQVPSLPAQPQSAALSDTTPGPSNSQPHGISPNPSGSSSDTTSSGPASPEQLPPRPQTAPPCTPAPGHHKVDNVTMGQVAIGCVFIDRISIRQLTMEHLQPQEGLPVRPRSPIASQTPHESPQTSQQERQQQQSRELERQQELERQRELELQQELELQREQMRQEQELLEKERQEHKQQRERAHQQQDIRQKELQRLEREQQQEHERQQEINRQQQKKLEHEQQRLRHMLDQERQQQLLEQEQQRQQQLLEKEQQQKIFEQQRQFLEQEQKEIERQKELLHQERQLERQQREQKKDRKQVVQEHQQQEQEHEHQGCRQGQNTQENNPKNVLDSIARVFDFSVPNGQLENIYAPIRNMMPDMNLWYLLRRLDLSKQNIRALNGLGRNFPMLETLNVSHNELKILTDLPSTLCYLYASHNRLTELDLYHLGQLHYLDCSHNLIQEFGIMSALKSLREMDASYNNIETCDVFRTLRMLMKLSLQHNNIQSLAGFEGLVRHQLDVLDLSYNRIEIVDSLDSLPHLAKINLNNNCIQAVRLNQPMRNVVSVKLCCNRLSTIDLSMFPAAKLLFLDNNQIQTVSGASLNSHLTSFSLRDQGRERSEFHLHYLRRTQKLYLSGSPFRKMHQLVDFYALEYLELCSVELQELPSDFSKRVPNLRNLYLSMNRLKDIRPLKKLLYLQRLILIDNQLLSLNEVIAVVKHMPMLNILDLRQNPMTANIYPRINTFSNDTVSPYIYTAHDTQWPAQDIEYCAHLSTHWKTRRNVYRAFLMKEGSRLTELDRLPINVTDRRNAEVIIANYLQMPVHNAV